MSERERNDYQQEQCDDGLGGNDNGDPRNPPLVTPGALTPIQPEELPTSEDLGGDA